MTFSREDAAVCAQVSSMCWQAAAGIHGKLAHQSTYGFLPQPASNEVAGAGTTGKMARKFDYMNPPEAKTNGTRHYQLVCIT